MTDNLTKKLKAIKPSVQPMDSYVADPDEAEDWLEKRGTWFAQNDVYWWTYLDDDAIEQITQAFIDDGWIKVPQVEIVEYWDKNQPPELFMVNGKEVMTGQEWEQKAIADGWLSPKQAKELTSVKKHVVGCQTGEDWYTRFEKEMYNLKPDDYTVTRADIFNTAVKAAKRAAGIK